MIVTSPETVTPPPPHFVTIFDAIVIDWPQSGFFITQICKPWSENSSRAPITILILKEDRYYKHRKFSLKLNDIMVSCFFLVTEISTGGLEIMIYSFKLMEYGR